MNGWLGTGKRGPRVADFSRCEGQVTVGTADWCEAAGGNKGALAFISAARFKCHIRLASARSDASMCSRLFGRGGGLGYRNGQRFSGITCSNGSGVSAISPVKGRSWERMSKKVVASAAENRPIATADVSRLSQ